MITISVIRGDTFTANAAVFKADGSVFSLSGCTLWFSIKSARDVSADDSGALVSLYWQDGGISNGITVATPSNGTAVIKVPKESMALLINRTNYIFDLRVLDAGGDRTTVVRGTATVDNDVTIRFTVP